MEKLDYYNKNGKWLGVEDKEIVHEKGLIHKVVHVWVVNSKNQILLQKRSKQKKLYGGFWDISFAGHISAGETPLEALFREGKEELNISINEANLTHLMTFKDFEEYENLKVQDNEIVEAYIYKTNQTNFVLQEEEVDEVKFVSLDEFVAITKGNEIVPHTKQFKKLIKILKKSEKLKGKIVGIDIDNTITSMNEGVLAYGQNFSIEKTGKLSIPLDIYGDDTDVAFDWSDEFDYEFWRRNIHDLLWKIQPKPLFVKMVNNLRKEGYKIYIITSRKEQYFGKPIEFTKKWLRKNKIKYDKFFIEGNKGLLCVKENIDYFIDDSPKYYLQTIEEGINTYVMNSYVNVEDKNPALQRVSSFVEFYYAITGKALFTSKENKRYFTKEFSVGSKHDS